MTELNRQIARLAELSFAELKLEWCRTTNTQLPRVSAALLRLALAWEYQARASGGLSRETKRRLDQLAAARTSTRTVQPGMRLVREWNGQAHIVSVGDDGIIRWDERDWRSLSEVAKAISGTHWSGPAFFGLKRKLVA